METITIPSPSVFLDSPTIKPAPEPPPASPPPKRKSVTTAKTTNAHKKQDGATKPKQSKSRNGMSIYAMTFLIVESCEGLSEKIY